MRLAANLRPNLRVRLEAEVAHGTVARCPGPFRDLLELIVLARAEELLRLLQRSLQPTRTDVILPPLHEDSLELHRQSFLQDGNVFI